MNSKTRKRIWPVALMPLAILGVVAVVVALSAMGPQTTLAQTPPPPPPPATVDCASLADAINAASCNTCQTEGGVWNTTTNMCETPTTTPPATPVTPTPSVPGGGNGGGTAPATGSGSDATELPHAVANLMVIPYERAEGGTPQEQLKISWDAPPEGGPVTGYRIDFSIDEKEWFAYIGDHAGADLRVIYGDEEDPDANERPLLAEDSRYFRVFAFNKRGTGPGVEAQGTTEASWVPDPATDLRADVVLGPLDLNSDGDEGDMADTGRYATDMDKIQEWNNSTEHPELIDLRWMAPEDPPGAPVTGYEIEYSSDGTRWFTLEEMIGTDEEFRDISLIANEVRYYRIYAWNAVGRSLVSENAAFETSGPSLTPVLPAEIKHIVMSPNATDLRITWTTPPNPLGDPVERYEIQAKASAMDDSAYRSVVTGSFADNLRIDANTTTFVTSSQDLSRADGPNIAFEAGTLVDVRIRPGNRAGFSGDDTSVSGDEWLVISNIPWGDSNLPLKQRQPRAEQDTEQNEGRSGLDVYWHPAKFVTRQGPDEDGNDATDFESQVRYVLVIGNEEEAEADSYRMEDGAAAGQADTRGHVGADDARQTTNDDNLETQRSRQYTVYPVRVLADLSPTFSISGHDVSTDTLDVIRGFPSETERGITNRPLPPGTPADFYVSEDGHTEIRLTWAEPVENPDRLCQNTVDDAVGNDRRLGGGPTSDPELEDDGSECGKSVITEYRVYMSEDGISDWDHLADVSAGGSEYVATELTPGERYYFRVSAVNSNQEGDPTEHESAVTEQTDLPTQPGGLVAQAVSSTQLKLCWFSHNLLDPQTGEALDEDLPVLGYRITYVDANDSEVILVSNTMSMDTVYEDPSVLEPNETRTYRVRGINLANLHLVDDETDATLGGTPYAEASATTDDAMVTPQPPDTTLSAPDNVMASDAGNPVTVTWNPGMNADGGHLILVFNSDFTEVPGIAVPTEEGTHTFTDVTFAAGDYVAVVVSIKARDDYLYDYDTFTVQ